ncbi:uncharacterized protein FOMMEDRAFT_168526 [Fomitiporia mediterranea MF3/22]|uniref:uncharacterized protein n=1 Tax=Fomitiporia mediterranea (strain MF3/22) TaxID=694068 RepID=UPI0004407FCF|nr:uncharacterized protein FOMMEDRAFT_168526 [Fomitiporia mediterranea MF3/22]EJD01945.1 hypothetical protein FOMMEDRAFT_168526 [Fomitiporia mediterranea MF3/22]
MMVNNRFNTIQRLSVLTGMSERSPIKGKSKTTNLFFDFIKCFVAQIGSLDCRPGYIYVQNVLYLHVGKTTSPASGSSRALVVAVSLASNDWTTPCHAGECSYHIPESQHSMGATLKISGSPSAISDISTAAGWEVFNCSANASAQDIRVVCSGDESVCSHIFKDGAEHTIVRLPEGCGRTPFARVSRAWISEDQVIPAHVRSKLKKRDGNLPPVHALSLDTDFGKSSSSNKGDVSLFVFASTIPGMAESVSPPPVVRQHARDILSRNASGASPADFDIFSSIIPSDGLGSFVRNTTKNSIPINVDQQFNVFNSSLPCTGNANTQISVDADLTVQGEIDLGVVAQGTIVPPKFNQFGIFATMSADLGGTLNLGADLSGEIDSPEITLVNVGLPGLSIPDVISLGPSVTISAKATANIDINMNMGVGLGYSISNLTLFLPPSAGHSSSAVVTPKDIPLGLSVSPGIKSSTSFSAHLIPALNLGVVAFDIDTAAFLKFDTSATLSLDLNAGADASIDTTGATSNSTDVNGCVDVSGGVSVNVGLDAKSPLFDLLGNSATINLAEKDLDFFKKCLPDVSSSSVASPSATGTASPQGRALGSTLPFTRGMESDPLAKRAGFSCPSNAETVETSIVNTTLSSSSFQGN